MMRNPPWARTGLGLPGRAGIAPGFSMCRVPGGGLAEGWPVMPVPAGADSASLCLLPGRADGTRPAESGSAVPLRGRFAK